MAGVNYFFLRDIYFFRIVSPSRRSTFSAPGVGARLSLLFFRSSSHDLHLNCLLSPRDAEGAARPDRPKAGQGGVEVCLLAHEP